MKRAILLFVKWPEPGRVKTRIAATLGSELAVEIYRKLVAAVCARLPREVPVIVCFDPADEADAVRDWLEPMLPQAAGWHPQVAGDLGDRLKAGFAGAFAAGWEQVAVVGSDCTEITAEVFEAAWTGLDENDVAVGPTNDGGYYLLAMGAQYPGLFEGIRWSSEHTLHDTMRSAGESGLSVCRLVTLSDVDTAEDWSRVAPTLPG